MGSMENTLRGKCIVVTRAREQAEEFARRVEQCGGRVLYFPMVAYEPPRDSATLDRALDAISSFDWLVFTSQNAVRFFAARARQRNVNPAQMEKLLVAAVGPETVRAAEAEGYRVAHVAAVHSGMALANELGAKLSGRRVLLPRSDLASEELPKLLSAQGAVVTDVIAYRTVQPRRSREDALRLLLAQPVDAVTFASPSAFQHFADVLGADEVRKLASTAAFAVIGPTTAQALRHADVRVAVEAPEATMESLFAALKEYFAVPVSGAERT
jgi:uroporphyrinogen-III synthase